MSAQPYSITYTKTIKHDEYLCATCNRVIHAHDLGDHTVNHDKDFKEAIARAADNNIEWSFTS